MDGPQRQKRQAPIPSQSEEALRQGIAMINRGEELLLRARAVAQRAQDRLRALLGPRALPRGKP
jgi:hypothetical protein